MSEKLVGNPKDPRQIETAQKRIVELTSEVERLLRTKPKNYLIFVEGHRKTIKQYQDFLNSGGKK